MAKDLHDMSRDELLKLRSDVDKALESVERRRKDEAKRAAEEAARAHGFSLSDIFGGDVKKGKTVSAPKYRNPENPDQTWTGRGRQPGWIKEGLQKGRSLDDFAI